MESTLSATTLTLLTISKTLNSNANPFVSHLHRRFSSNRPTRCLRTQDASLRLRHMWNSDLRRSSKFGSISSSSMRSLYPVAIPQLLSRLECVSSSAASFASGGGHIGGSGVSGGGGGGGDGDGSADGVEAKANTVAGGPEEVSALSSDVIILDVGGMTCGGCAASVKRILESQPQVSSASVNLTTETAIVWPVSEAKLSPNWQKHLGETLANHLTNCGFKSNLQGQGAIEGDTLS